MTVYILVGDVMDRLRQLPDGSVHCVITSPPYWGLRDYGVAGQMGMESTLAEHLAAMVAVFREVRRVLRADGTCWVNYGDCYATTPNGRSAADTKAAGGDDRTFRDKPFSTIGGVLKPKDLCMLPNRLAIALQEDGWWIRSEIVWHKLNPMPESAKDRPGQAHEKLFLITKSARYFYDADAVRETRTSDEDANGFRGGCYVGGATGNETCGKRAARGNKRVSVPKVGGWAVDGPHSTLLHNRGERGRAGSNDDGGQAAPSDGGRNLRNVWTIATRPFPEAHFATFPPDLVVPCILAGCPRGGVVLDPFGGSGTTGLVADRLQRDAILIELNPAYAAMAKRRIEAEAGLLARVEIDLGTPEAMGAGEAA